LSSESVTQDFIGRLRAFVRRRVRSDADAEDITQDVLLKFVRAGNSIAEGRGPAWMLTVARREIIDRSRRLMLAVTRVDTELVAADEPAETATIAELSDCVQPLIEQLSPEDREILNRVDIQGESQLAIAEALQLPRSTIKARVQRARKRFHKQLIACCAITCDSRGTPTDFEPRGGHCDCNSSTSQCSHAQL